MTSLGECYFGLKGYKNEEWKKKRTNEEKEMNVEKKSKGLKLSNWNKFCLVAFLS